MVWPPSRCDTFMTRAWEKSSEYLFIQNVPPRMVIASFVYIASSGRCCWFSAVMLYEKVQPRRSKVQPERYWEKTICLSFFGEETGFGDGPGM